MANTCVVALPGVAMTANLNTETQFDPRKGYRKAIWRVDDAEVSKEPIANRSM